MSAAPLRVTQSMGTISAREASDRSTLCAHRYTQVLLEEYDDDRSYALRRNAAQDAPRPVCAVTRSMGVISGQGYLRRSGAGGKYWYSHVSLSVRSPVRMNMRISTGSTESLSGTQSKVIR